MKPVVLALAALTLGLGLGLLYAWVISPVQLVEADPASLSAADQAEYLHTIARAYAADGDLARARVRLALLGEGGSAQAVTALAQRGAAEGAEPGRVQALSALALALGAQPAPPTGEAVVAASSGAAPGATPLPGTPGPAGEARLTPAPTDTRLPTITPHLLPTRTPTATPPGAFRLASRQQVCNPQLEEPLIQVITQDAAGQQIPGVEVIVEWDGGFDHFFTGLKPELGRGYGDFTMTPGVEYRVHLASSPGAILEGLGAVTCSGDLGEAFAGSWLLVFREP